MFIVIIIIIFVILNYVHIMFSANQKELHQYEKPTCTTIYVHVHHSDFQIVLENYTMEKKSAY